MGIRESYCDYVNPYLGSLLTKVGLDKVFTEGRGSYLYDDEGARYLDFLSNYGACVLGHNHPPLKAALQEYLDSNRPVFVQPSMGPEAATLARRLVELSPTGLAKVVFTNSGAESVELCIKVARAATGRDQVLSAVNSFHGKTISALSATGQASYQRPYALPLPGFHYVPFGDLGALESRLSADGEKFAAFVIEPIQGEGGVIQAPSEYFLRAQALCRRHGIKFIVDEVQTGIGRAGHLFYSRHLGLEPDAIALAKGLGGGLLAIGAVLLTDELYTEEVGLTHSSTFAGNGLACRVGNAVLDELCANDQAALRQARETGAYLKGRLAQIQERHASIIGRVKGDGLMLGVEFCVGPETFKSDLGSMLGLAADSGLLLPLLSGYLANAHRVRVAPTLNSKCTLRVQPPLNVTRGECDFFCEALEETVSQLSRGDTYSVIRRLLDSGTERVAHPVDALDYRFQASPAESDGRFGFLIHPLTLNSFADFDHSLRGVSPVELREMANLFGGDLKAAVVGTTRVAAKDGATIYGEFAAVPLLPEQMMTLPADKVVGVIKDAILLLKERGAKIVGLGGYTSIVTKGGSLVSNLGVAVTTGNNYTVLSAIQAVNMAVERFTPGDRGSMHVAVVGAAGSIGSTIAREIAVSARRLTLVGSGRSIEKTRRRIVDLLTDLGHLLMADRQFCMGVQPGSVAARFKALIDGSAQGAGAVVTAATEIVDGKHPHVGIAWGTDANSLLPEADVAFVATNSPDVLIHPHHLKRNAIVCDLSRPSNVNHCIALHRPDVLVLDGGVIQTPRLDDLGVNFGFPKGLCLACMAETMMLAFDGRYENTSLGARLTYEDQVYFKDKAEEYGFTIAGFRSFDLPITDAAMERLRLARSRSTRLEQRSAAFEAYANITRFLLEQHTGAGPDGIALYADAPVSYGEAYRRVRQVAAAIKRLGCDTGDRVAILADGGVESVYTLLACFHIGAVAVVLNPHSSDDELSAIVTQPPLKLLLDGTRRRRDLGMVPVSLATLSELADGCPADEPPVSVTADHPAIIFSTPGSTGRQRKVCHSHGDIFATFRNYGEGVLGLTATDRLFSTSPCYFIYGFKCLYLGLASGGGAILAPARPTPEAVAAITRRFKPTHLFSVPTIYLRLLHSDPPAGAFAEVKQFISAGEPLPLHLFDAWRERFGKAILDNVGTTESMCFVIANYPDDVNPGSSGKPVPGYQMKLLNESGEESRTGELGVLWIKGSTVVNRYVDSAPEEYQDCFVDDWFKTNDVFYRNDMGWYYFQGRANDMVKVGGEWLSPKLLEETISRHPWVARSAVRLVNEVGLLNRPVAYVVPSRKGVSPEDLASELKEYCRSSLARNQYPHLIKVVDELPRAPAAARSRRVLRTTRDGAANSLVTQRYPSTATEP